METLQKCKTCEKAFPLKKTRHIIIHSDKHLYRCAFCEKCFSNNSNLSRHRKNIHMTKDSDETPYKCRACKKSFTSKLALTRHLRMHTSEGSYPCLSCDKSFTERIDLTKHFVTAHSVKTLYQCSICNEYFSNLLKHMGSHKIKTESEQLADVPNFNDLQSEIHKVTSRGLSNKTQSEILTGKYSSLNDATLTGLHNADNPYIIHIKTEEDC